MPIAARLRHHLYNSRVDFELVTHKPASTTLAAARQANIPADHVAKSVVVRHIDGYAVAVVPSDRQVDLHALQDVLHYRLGLAPEHEIIDIFKDCDPGAVPPIGSVYGLTTLVDFELDKPDWIWFEAGDHQTMIKVSREGFQRIMRDVEHASISCGTHY